MSPAVRRFWIEVMIDCARRLGPLMNTLVWKLHAGTGTVDVAVR